MNKRRYIKHISNSSLLKKTVFCIISVLFICSTICVYISNVFILKSQKNLYRVQLETQANSVVEDITRQIEIMDDIANRIAISGYFSPALWKRNKFYEIQLVDHLSNFSNYSQLTSDIILWWDENPKDVFFCTASSSGKSMLNTFIKTYDRNIDINAFTASVADTEDGKFYSAPSSDNILYLIFHIHTGKHTFENRATVCFVVPKENLVQRLSLITGNENDDFSLFQNGNCIYSYFAYPHTESSDQLTFISESSEWTVQVNTDYYTAVKLTSPYNSTIRIIVIAVTIVLFLISTYVVYKNWLPIHEIIENYSQLDVDIPEQKQLEEILNNAEKAVRINNIRTEKQAVQLRNNTLILLLNGIIGPDVQNALWSLPQDKKGKYFRVICLRKSESLTDDIMSQFTTLTDENITVMSCVWDSQYGYNLVIRAVDIESLDETIMSIRDLIDINHLNISFGIGSICEDYCDIHKSYVDAVQALNNDFIDINTTQRAEKIENILAYINDTITDPAINLNLVADHFGMNPSYLSVLLKKELGVNYKTYVIRQRDKIAKELLLTTDLSLNEICERSGFTECSYFIKVFRDMNGVTPGEYRMLNKHS